MNFTSKKEKLQKGTTMVTHCSPISLQKRCLYPFPKHESQFSDVGQKSVLQFPENGDHSTAVSNDSGITMLLHKTEGAATPRLEANSTTPGERHPCGWMWGWENKDARIASDKAQSLYFPSHFHSHRISYRNRSLSICILNHSQFLMPLGTSSKGTLANLLFCQ